VVSVVERFGIPSVCPVFFQTLIQHVAHSQRDSPGGSMHCSQHASRPDSKEDQPTCLGSFALCIENTS